MGGPNKVNSSSSSGGAGASSGGVPNPKAAKAAAATSAAATGAAKAHGGEFFANIQKSEWFGNVQKLTSKAGQDISGSWKGIQSAAQKGVHLPAVPMDLKVDFLGPTLESVKQGANKAWTAIPPDVRRVTVQALPLAGAAVAGGAVGAWVEQRKFRVKEEEYLEQIQSLNALNASLKQEMKMLHDKNKQLVKDVTKARDEARGSSAEQTARMAQAVAKATEAAAAAASAAANTAQSCSYARAGRFGTGPN